MDINDQLKKAKESFICNNIQLQIKSPGQISKR